MSTSNIASNLGCGAVAQPRGATSARSGTIVGDKLLAPPASPRGADAQAAGWLMTAEAAAATALTVAIAALWSPGDVWLVQTGFHPVWLAVLVLAAAYGARGLFVSLTLSVALLAVVSLTRSGGLTGLWLRAEHGADLTPLAASVLVAWIAMLHQGRQAAACLALTSASARQAAAESTTEALRESLALLRARHDRLDLSLSMWREVAARMERGDPGEASRAALELCALRSGASAGVVQRWDGVSLRTLAGHGQGSPAQPRPRDICTDRTAAAAVANHRAVTVLEVGAEAELSDSDVAVPIMGSAPGSVLGVISLRGVSPSRLRATDLRDFTIIAQWLAPTLAASARVERTARNLGLAVSP